jgi:hypothetical protein
MPNNDPALDIERELSVVAGWTDAKRQAFLVAAVARWPVYRNGLGQPVAAPLVKLAAAPITANDRRWLKSMRIAAD